MPYPRGVSPLVKFVQRSTSPEAFIDLEVGLIRLQGNRVSRIGLDLDRVGTRLFGLLDDAKRRLNISVVIGRHLGDDVGRCPGTNLAPGNIYGMRHLSTSQQSIYICGRAVRRMRGTWQDHTHGSDQIVLR